MPRIAGRTERTYSLYKKQEHIIYLESRLIQIVWDALAAKTDKSSVLWFYDILFGVTIDGQQFHICFVWLRQDEEKAIYSQIVRTLWRELLD